MDSPCESSESSLDGVGMMLPPSPISREEQLQKRIESLTQQNRVLKVEMETYKIRVKVLQEENRALRQASVIIQAKAEQEEEYISNTLLKKIQALKKEKESLAHHYEREEECLTNDLSRKLDQLRQEKCKLEQTLEEEQECLVNKLMRKIEKLEAETLSKQTNLEQLRREMIELENTLEQEQEALVNKLWKRMDKLEAEKRSLQIKLDQPISDPSTPKYDTISDIANSNGADTASNLSNHIQTLRSEVMRLRNNLAAAQKETQQFAAEEKSIREENLRLQRKLQMEVERREALCRHLSESESSLEMEEERLYNESLLGFNNSSGSNLNRQRTISSPIPHSPSSSRPISPGGTNFPARCCTCGQILNASSAHMSNAFFHPIASAPISGRRTSERFIKPAIPSGLNTSAPTIMPASFGSLLGLGSASSLTTPGSSSSAAAGGGGGGNRSDHSSSSTSSMNNSFSSNNSMTTPTSTQPPTTGGSSSNPGTPGGGGSAFIQPASPMMVDSSTGKE